MQNNSNSSGQSVASLVLGILSIIIPFVGLILGILGLIFSVKGRREEEKKGMATAGLVLSIIGVVFSSIVIACTVCSCIVYEETYDLIDNTYYDEYYW